MARTKLLQDELIKNNSKLDQLMQIAESSFEETEQDPHAVFKLFENFIAENNITLENLSGDEDMALLQILHDTLNVKDLNDSTILQRLNHWKGQLKHAVYGQGEQITVHTARSSGMAADLMNKGFVSLDKWGTDLDILHCLNPHLTRPQEITAPGVYTLFPFPVSLTEAVESVNTLIAEVFQTLANHNILEEVTLYIPANCGDSHWRLMELKIKNLAISSAILWDSMEGNKYAEQSQAFRNFSNIASAFPNGKGKAKLQFAGIQENGYSCMDFVLREIYQRMNINHPITLIPANNAVALRLEIIKEIATHHPSLGAVVAANLKLANGRVNQQVKTASNRQKPEIQSTEIKQLDALLNRISDRNSKIAISKEETSWQIKFDNIFANHLQHLYNVKKDITREQEIELVKTAYKNALQEIGFFPSEKQENKNIIIKQTTKKNSFK